MSVTRREIVLDYAPRKIFMPYHDRQQRFAAIVAHRRAGKTVACINDKIKRAMMCKQPEPRLAYIAPLYNQAKDVAWTYLKRYSEPLWASQPNESELRVDLINGARIRLYGADNPDRMRGLYFDDATLDEYADMNPAIWGEVIRPALSDRQGTATFIGTPKGYNSFFDMCERAKTDKDWFFMALRASETGILPQSELDMARKDMTKDQYEQEFECSFEAAILGAVYGDWMNIAEREGRIRDGLFDPDLLVHTGWDLGFDDATAIWFYQIAGTEIRLVDYYENSQQDIRHYCDILNGKPYKYGRHSVPHDAAQKLLAAGGRSIVQQAYSHGVQMFVTPVTTMMNSIEAARKTLGNCWFDKDKCFAGIQALRQYQFSYDNERKVFTSKPVHDWSSHAADAFEIIGQTNVITVKAEENKGPRFLQDMTASELFFPEPQGVRFRERI